MTLPAWQYGKQAGLLLAEWELPVTLQTTCFRHVSSFKLLRGSYSLELSLPVLPSISEICFS